MHLFCQNMRWLCLFATRGVGLVRRWFVAGKKWKRIPEVCIRSPLFSLKLCVPLLCYKTTRRPRAVDWQSDVHAKVEMPAPPLPGYQLCFWLFGTGPDPTSWEHGPGGCSRQLLGNDTMREFIGEDVSACGFGGRNAAPVVLALRELWSAVSDQARSQWCSINFVPHQDLFPNNLWQQQKKPKKNTSAFCSILSSFGVLTGVSNLLK